MAYRTVGRYSTGVVRKRQDEPKNPASTREAILETAAELFSTKGFAGTSMADLAENLGLSKAAIYHHFESKESIFQNLLQSTNEELENLINEHKELPSSQSEMHAILKQFAEFMFSHRDVVRLALSEMHADVKAQGTQSHLSMLRLHQLLAGKRPTAESRMRARIAIGIVGVGILPPPHEGLPIGEDVNLDLLVNIASEALRISPSKK